VGTIATRLSFEEFANRPDNGRRYELRHGELAEVAPPMHGHRLIQRRLRRLLESAGGSSGEIEIEMGSRPCAGDEFLIADVAFVSRDRWDNIPLDGYLQGAPELVIEVLSPSNLESEMRNRRRVCLENGCREFWMVDSAQREVKVSTPDGHSVTYRGGQHIPLFFAPGSNLAVDGIFE
jgi:Uma2 family endonuclease